MLHCLASVIEAAGEDAARLQPADAKVLVLMRMRVAQENAVHAELGLGGSWLPTLK